MINIVYQYITKYEMISEGDLIVAGVSGGADSVCLLMQLCEYRRKVPFALEVVHVNHQIRKDAMSDAQYVSQLCDKLDVPFHLVSENVEKYARDNGLSSEEAGRIIRYNAFNQIIRSHNGTGKIAIAHNRNDIAETVMFNMFRGTGIEGLCSLAPVNGNIIRPLLGMTRSDIEQYLADKRIDFRTDSTNLSNDYARNRIRNVILPYADENLCLNTVEHIAALSDKMRLLKDYLKKQTAIEFDRCVQSDSEISIDLNKFNMLDELIQQEIVLEALDRMTAGRKDIGDAHVHSILQIKDKSGEKYVSLPYDLEAVKKYDRLIIRKKKHEAGCDTYIELGCSDKVVLKDGKRITTRVFEYKEGMEIPQKAYTKWFDYDRITRCLVLRNRQSGDYLTINTSMSQKSIKDYLINEKVPREERDNLLMLAQDNHIVWVIGYRISEYYKVSSQTKRILEIEII